MKKRIGVAAIAGIFTAITASGCVSQVAFERDARAARPRVNADTVAPLAAAAQAASDRADRYYKNLQRCRFETPGRADRMLNRPATDPAIAACLARS
jgi:hypothetical protein